MIKFKEFLLLEEKNQFVVNIENVLKKLVNELSDLEDVNEIKEFKKEAAETFKKTMTNVINKVVKDNTYISDKQLVDDIKNFMKLIDFSDKIVDKYLEASLDEKKRESFESKLQSEVADDTKKEEKKEKKEKDEDETDETLEKKAKEMAKSGGDSKLEKEVELEIEKEKESPKKSKKVLLAVVHDRDGDEILKALVGETDLSVKEIEGLEYEDDVLKAINNGRKLKTPVEITRKVKDLKGTVVYFYDPKKKENEEKFWTVVKY